MADIAVTIGANVSSLVGGLKVAGKELDNFGGSTNKTAKNVGLMAGAAIAAGAAILEHIVSASFEAINAQADLAARFDTTSASMAVYNRAADLAGISTGMAENAATKLSVAISAAADGSGKAAETFARLHLNAADLANLPLDERIATVNAAINEQIPALERASVASELFGKKAGLVIGNMSPEIIARAAEEVRVFGLNLSEVDAAAVGNADDAIKTLGMAAEGAGQQLSVKLAPYIEAVGAAFFDSAKEGDGFGNAIQMAVEIGVGVVGAMADAIASLGRIIKAVSAALLVALSEPFDLASVSLEMFVRGLDKIPGIDLSETISALEDFNAKTLAVTQSYKDDFNAALEEPLPSEQFNEYVKKAKQAAKDSAQAFKDTPAGGDQVTKADPKAEAAAKKLDEDLARRLATLEDSYKTETQLLDDKLAKENALISEALSARKITEDKANEMRLAAAQNHADGIKAINEKAAEEESRKNAALMDKINAQRDSYKTETQLLEEKYIEQQKLDEEALAAKLITQQEFNELQKQNEKSYQDSINAIQQEASDKALAIKQAEHDALMSTSANALSAIGNLLAQGGRKDFENSKKLALASAAVSMYQGIAAGLKLGYPLAIPAVAYAAATGLSAINSIKSQNYGGGVSSGGVSSASGGAPALPTDNGGGTGTGGAIGGAQNITVRGINKNDFFSGQQLLEIIKAAQDNGGILRAG